MEMRHNGTHALDVPLAGLYGVKPGEPVEVADSHVRACLDRQGWEYVHDAEQPDAHEGDTDTSGNAEGDADSDETESEGDTE